ncbi:MAG: hypothetical protein LW854_15030 [Rubrivivax sp.]|jgi:predicted  nucleic acid-binding Zn-ribbon protein|nr:hypothetical protein [Rubrivivax sp.]
MHSLILAIFSARARAQQAVANVLYHVRRRALLKELDDIRDNLETVEHQLAILPAEERSYRKQYSATRDRILAMDQEHDRARADVLSRFAP